MATVSYADKTVAYLWEASSQPSLPPLLRNTLLSKCQKLQSAEATDVIKERAFKEQAMCSHCSNPWACGEFQVKINPARKTTKRMRKLLRKQEREPENLGKLQKALLKRFKHNTNMMEITCWHCKHKTVLDMKKPIKATADVPVKTMLTQIKKRKRRKEYKAGLIIPAKSQGSTTQKSPSVSSSKTRPVTGVAKKTASASLTLALKQKSIKRLTLNDPKSKTKIATVGDKYSKLKKMLKDAPGNESQTKGGLMAFLSQT